MRSLNVVTPAALFGGASAGFCLGLLTVAIVHSLAGEPSTVLAAPSTVLAVPHPLGTPSPHPRILASDAAIVLNFVKPEKAANFEAVIRREQEAFQQSRSLERHEQAVGWKVFKALNPSGDGNTLYVFIIDPVAKGADYSESAVLEEIFPAEAQPLFQQYVDSFAAGQGLVNLQFLASFGQ